MQPSDSQQPQQPENWQQPQTPPTEEFHPVAEPAPPAPVEALPTETQVETSMEADTTPVAPQDEPMPDGDEELIRWEAHDYIRHDRSALWYVILAVVVVVLVAVAIFLVKSITFAILIPVMAVALVVYARRPPQPVQYILSRKGLHVNDKLLSYDTFRAFSIVQHDGHNSIVLIPRKRFALAETIYFPDDAGETIVDMLAARLPMKDAKPDVFDRIISKLKL